MPGIRFGLLVSKDDAPETDPAPAGRRSHRAGYRRPRCRVRHDRRRPPVLLRAGFGRRPWLSLISSRFQPLLVLAHMAAALGDTVNYAPLVMVSPALNPVQLAEDAATLDAMTGGRLRLGLGLGWMPDEFEAFGVPIKGRVTRFEELVTATRALLTQDVVDFDGNLPVPQRPRGGPVRAAPSPADLDRGLGRRPSGGRPVGNAWTISAHLSINDLRQHLAVYQAELDRLGKPIPAERPITRHLPGRGPRARDKSGGPSGPGRLVPQARRLGLVPQAGRGHVGRGVADGRWIIGNPDDCIAQIRILHGRWASTTSCSTCPPVLAPGRNSGCAPSGCWARKYCRRSAPPPP